MSDLVGNVFEARRRLLYPPEAAAAERVVESRVAALAVWLAKFVVAPGWCLYGRHKVLVDDGRKGDFLEGAQLEFVAVPYRGDVDVAAARRVALGIKVYAHAFPEVAEYSGYVQRGIEARGHDFHADFGEAPSQPEEGYREDDTRRAKVWGAYHRVVAS